LLQPVKIIKKAPFLKRIDRTLLLLPAFAVTEHAAAFFKRKFFNVYRLSCLKVAPCLAGCAGVIFTRKIDPFKSLPDGFEFLDVVFFDCATFDHSPIILPKEIRITHIEILPGGCVLGMSMSSRREYLVTMCKRYKNALSRAEKSQVIDELVNVLGYHRKYAVQVLNNPVATLKEPVQRKRPIEYIEALPAIQLVWEVLDFPCAERLHPVLLSTAELLSKHGKLNLTPEIRLQMSQISRATLARRSKRLRSPKRTCTLPGRRPNTGLRAEIPVERYDWDETRPGALEVDLVEHNGGSSLGHFAYTLSVVDVVSGFSRRRAVLGRGQAGVHRGLKAIILDWPTPPWALHSDNGSEFISDQLLRFCQEAKLSFTRSRPYKKNDNAHVEQKNLQYVRKIVGYERYDTPAAVDWLNQVYSCLDPYTNLFLPMRKVIAKERHGSHVCKKFDTARTPFERLSETGAVTLNARLILQLIFRMSLDASGVFQGSNQKQSQPPILRTHRCVAQHQRFQVKFSGVESSQHHDIQSPEVQIAGEGALTIHAVHPD